MPARLWAGQPQLPLVDALCGSKIVFTQLDGRKLMIENKPGEVVKQDDWVCVEEEGMPHHSQPFLKVRRRACPPMSVWGC